MDGHALSADIYEYASEDSTGDGVDGEGDLPHGPAGKPPLAPPNVATDLPASFRSSVLARIRENVGSGRVELACLISLVLVLTQMYWGRAYNRRLADAWLRVAHPFYSETFAATGTGSSLLVSYGWNSFEYFASGHSSCSYALVKLDLHARQCFWRYLWGLISGFNDVMDIEIGLLSQERFSVMVGRRMRMKALQELHSSLEEVVSYRKLPGLSPALCVLSDSNEATERLLSQSSSVVSLFNKAPAQLEHLIVTDLVPSERFSRLLPKSNTLRLRYKLPHQHTNFDDIIPILQGVLRLVDVAAALRLSDKAKESVKKTREPLIKKQEQAAEEERLEALNKKKAEKREEEERSKSLTPQMVQKREEKRQRKEAKQRLPRVKMVKM